jgi:hypothetical protein
VSILRGKLTKEIAHAISEGEGKAAFAELKNILVWNKRIGSVGEILLLDE